MAEDSDESVDQGDDQAPGETTDTKSRHWLTNDVAALALTGVVCVLMLFNATPYYAAPDLVVQAFVMELGIATVWLFGKGAAKTIFGQNS